MFSRLTLPRDHLLSQRRFTAIPFPHVSLFLFSLSFSRDITPRLDAAERYVELRKLVSMSFRAYCRVIAVSRYFDEIELPSTTEHNAGGPTVSVSCLKKVLSFHENATRRFIGYRASN